MSKLSECCIEALNLEEVFIAKKDLQTAIHPNNKLLIPIKRDRKLNFINSKEIYRNDHVLRALRLKKKTHIINASGTDALAIVSPRQVNHVAGVEVGIANFEVGIEFEKMGDLQIQKVRLPANYDKKIRLDTKKFYVTIKLKVENEWRILFQNRLFCCDQDIVLYKRHVKEINDYRIE